MAGNNIHSQLTDSAEIHVPKGFTEAANHTGLIKNLAGQLQWVDLDSLADKSNFSATVDPTPNDDFTQGYTAGSRWINTVQNNIFFCVHNATGAAIWVPVIRVNSASPNPPTIYNDASQGYKEGSVWIQLNSPMNIAWMCADSFIGNAQWIALSQNIVVGIDHRTLSHMVAPADDHTQYLHIDGRRGMTGDFHYINSFSTGINNMLQPDSTYTDITTLSSLSSPVGLLADGDISPPISGLTVGIEAGIGYLYTAGASLKKITWPNTNFNVPANSAIYLYFDSTGTLQGNVTKPSPTENIILGKVVSDSSRIMIIEESGFSSIHASNQIGQALRGGLGAIYSNGSLVAEIGTRNLAISSGEYYYGERQFLCQGGSPVSFTSFYQNGLGGFVNSGLITQVDNTSWDNGSGTLVPLAAGNFAKHSIYALGDSSGDFDSEAYFLVYSQAQYTDLTLAEQGNLPNPPSYLSDAVALIASVIVQQGATNIIEIRDERPLFSGKRVSSIAATTYHHNLLGLNDFDDHLRYLPVDGSRPMTGNIPMGGNNINNANTVNAQVVNVNDIPLGDSSTKAPNTKYVEQTAVVMALIFG